MIRPEFNKELENQRRVTLILWVAFLLTILFLLWVPKIFPVRPSGFVNYPVRGSVRTFLWLFAFGESGFLFWWKKRFLSKEALFQKSSTLRLVPNVVKGGQTPEEEAAGKAVSFYLWGEVLAFAICESIALYGLVLAYIGVFFWDQYVLTGISALLLTFFYPSRSFFADLIGSVYWERAPGKLQRS